MCPQPAARPVSRAASPLPGGCVPGLTGGQVHLDAHMPTQPCPRPRKQLPARSVWTPTRRPPWEAWPGLMPVTRWPVGPAGTWHWTESLTLWRPRAGRGALRESLLGCESSVAGRGPRLHWAVPLQSSEDHGVQPPPATGVCLGLGGGRSRGPPSVQAAPEPLSLATSPTWLLRRSLRHQARPVPSPRGWLPERLKATGLPGLLVWTTSGSRACTRTGVHTRAHYTEAPGQGGGW